MIKKIFSLFAAILFAGSMWAGQVTISPTQALNEGGVDPITVACAKGDGTSNPAISGGQLRLYQAASGKTTGNTITFSSSKSITSIVFTFANNMTASNGSFSEGSYDSESSTWTGSTTSLTLTVTGKTSGTRIYITNMVVTYDDGGTPVCVTPTFDPEDGETFTDNIDVEIACATDGATIYYTTDGNDPTTSSNVYSTALNFTETTTLKAIAVKAGYDNSTVATAIYTKVVPFDGEILEITKDDFVGSYASNNGEHTKDGVTYTTNQVCLSSSSIQFQKANGYLYNNTDLGEIAKIEITTVSGKSNNLVVYSGTTENPTSGTVTGSASGSVTTYTFASGKGFFAINCNSNGTSNVDPIKIYYTPATPAAVAKPTITGDENAIISGNYFVDAIEVTITKTGEGEIYYTTDGKTPTAASEHYTGPFWLDKTATVKAIVIKGEESSEIAEKEFIYFAVVDCATARIAALSVSENNEVYKEGEVDVFTIRGYVTNMDKYSESNYFWIADEQGTSKVLEVYKPSQKGTGDLALNQAVEVTGKLTKYNTTPEFASGCTFEILADGITTSVDNTVDGKKAVKFIENGQLFIELNGHVYNVQGQIIK